MQRIEILSWERLTKYFFLSLEKGIFLTSNTTTFAEYIAPVGLLREEQWLRIKNAKAQYRHCTLYRNHEDSQRNKELMDAFGRCEIEETADGRVYHVFPNAIDLEELVS